MGRNHTSTTPIATGDRRGSGSAGPALSLCQPVDITAITFYTGGTMDVDVNASELLTLLSQRLSQIIVEMDTYRLMVQKLQQGNEELVAKVISYMNVVKALENQVAELGVIPVTQSSDSGEVNERHPDE